MAKAKQAPGKEMQIFYDLYDLTKRTKVEKPYSWIEQKLDTRAGAGGADPEFVEELTFSFKDSDAALTELLKHPIEVTGDGVIIVGRALAKAYHDLLATPQDPNPLIPLEVYDDIPSFRKLSDNDRTCLRWYAVSRDLTKSKQRGLRESDKLYNMREAVDAGWTRESCIEAAVEAGVPRWKAEKLYAAAANARTNALVYEGKKRAKVAQKAARTEGTPWNPEKICNDLGLDPTKYTKVISDDKVQNHSNPVKLNHLLKKQQWVIQKAADSHYAAGTPQSLADNNIEWYRRSANNQLVEGERPLEEDVYLGLMKEFYQQSLSVTNFFKDAYDRAQAEVAKVEPVRKQREKYARLRKQAGIED